ncbi:hypothetical protein G195_000744 [Phytophthora kernoviae 00238/432]|uniref:Amidohydrolase-related domain-containing protein n=1 Tax=Phytophthora kernoviae 00238/432 TaxID=1284355 RepID=A0A8J4T1X8_9STRA|nr:hypothetical protein G195_000744 [Phytophthora kernoviae 00238/432]
MKDTDPPFTGDIRIVGDRITEIALQIQAQPGDDIIDGKYKLAMPGLINAHQHTPMSLLRGFSDDLKLMDWLDRKMLPAEARMTPEDIYWGAQLSIAEMIRSGTTAYADIANGADVDTTIVNGRVLMRGRQLVTIDEEELFRQVEARAKRIVEGI